MIIVAPVRRVPQHGGVQRFPYLGKLAPFFPCEKLLLDRSESKNSLPKRKGQPRADFQNRKVIFHHFGESFRRLVVRRVRFIDQRGKRRQACTESAGFQPIISKDNVIPEFLQQDCSPEKLAQALGEVLGDSALRRKQTEAFAKIDQIMSTGNQPPSVRAADIVLATLRKSRG